MRMLIMTVLFALSSTFVAAYAEDPEEFSGDVMSSDPQTQRGPPRAPPRNPPRNPRPPRPPGVPRRPSTVFIGDFKTGNPLSWDNDTIDAGAAYGWWNGVVFELSQGTDVELGSVTVTCNDGSICFQARLREYVQRGRPVYVNFRYGLDVSSVSVQSRPNGVSIPSARVNVYLYQ